LLRQPWRTVEGIKRVRELAASLGIKPTAEGLATLSAEMSLEDFAAVFEREPQKVKSRPPKDKDFGRTGGYICGELPIPQLLLEYVDSITIASPYLRM
jgi:hypothetical protein